MEKIVSCRPISDEKANVQTVNSIAKLYKEVRQASKSPSFAMQ